MREEFPSYRCRRGCIWLLPFNMLCKNDAQRAAFVVNTWRVYGESKRHAHLVVINLGATAEAHEASRPGAGRQRYWSSTRADDATWCSAARNSTTPSRPGSHASTGKQTHRAVWLASHNNTAKRPLLPLSFAACPSTPYPTQLDELDSRDKNIRSQRADERRRHQGKCICLPTSVEGNWS